MKVFALLSFTACGIGLLLCGCGGGTVPPANAKPDANALAGNWLLVGPMPTQGLLNPPGFRLAVTFDVVGSKVVAAGFGNDFCGILQTTFGFGSLATGMVGTDGSFNLQSPSDFATTTTVSIKGTAPKAGDLSWTGSYSSSFANNPFVPGCTRNQNGTFTATPFPLVSGVYVGTGSWNTIVDGVSTTIPVPIQVTLQQGGMVTDPTTGQSLWSNSVLEGSIRIQGIPCFNSGLAASKSVVEGNEVQAMFAMDDGTTLTVLGTLTDPTEARMAVTLFQPAAGKCLNRSSVLQLSELDRQN
jgi:hypothetical protein